MEQTLSPLLALMDRQWELAVAYIHKHQDQEWMPQFLAEDASGERTVFLTPRHGVTKRIKRPP